MGQQLDHAGADRLGQVFVGGFGSGAGEHRGQPGLQGRGVGKLSHEVGQHDAPPLQPLGQAQQRRVAQGAAAVSSWHAIATILPTAV